MTNSSENQKTSQTINIPGNGNVNFELRQPEVEDIKHAQLLGKTFVAILVCDANPDFVKSVFDELSKHYIRKAFDTKD